jgi:hypothetical protein
MMKKTSVARGVSLPSKEVGRMKNKPGSSNTGKYKDVAPSAFAGKSGGASKYSFPINTLARARNALSRAHYAPNPSGIKAAVDKKYPQLKKSSSSSKVNKK